MKRARLVILCALICSAVATAETPEAVRAKEMEAAGGLAEVRRVKLAALPPVVEVTPERYVEEYILPTLDDAWGGDFEKSIALLKALGMVPADFDAKAFLRKHALTTTAAAYDYLGKRILFPGRPVLRDALVHELMHASQDARFDIRKLMAAARGNFDETLAMGALLEGEALSVQLRYDMGASRTAAGLTPYGTLRDEARAYFETLNANAQRHLPGVPPAVLRAQALVYEEGVLFVEKLRRMERNWAAVDAAYRMPPRSTAQILHPEKYLAGEWPVGLEVRHVEKFLPGHAPAAENTLGEFGMRLFLETHGVDAGSAAKAAEGWRGDRILLYRSDRDGTETLVWVSTWESPERAAAAAKALEGAFRGARVWARQGDVTLVSGGGSSAMPNLTIIHKPSAEGRPLGGQGEEAR